MTIKLDDLRAQLRGDKPAAEKPKAARLKPRFANVKVQLSGADGNAFLILGRVAKAMREAGVTDAEIEEYRDEAQDSDYDNLLRVTMLWVDVS